MKKKTKIRKALSASQARTAGLLVHKAIDEYLFLAGRPGAEFKCLASQRQAKVQARNAARHAVALVWPFRRWVQLQIRKVKAWLISTSS